MVFDAEQIIATWKSRRGNREASVAMWDSIAEDFTERPIPSFDDDQLLGILRRFEMFDAKSRVLDIACGAGGHSLAIAPHVLDVVGIDISPKMLAHARDRATRMGIDNVRFVVGDWNDFDAQAPDGQPAFDLVFAHMTPAIESAETFEKLNAASRGWCVLSKPIRRTDPLSDGLRELLGIHDNRESGAQDILNGFSLLWQRRLDPRVEYRDVVWNHKRPLATAREFYLNRMRTYRDLDAHDLANAEEYLLSKTDADGMVGERTDVTVATLFWHV